MLGAVRHAVSSTLPSARASACACACALALASTPTSAQTDAPSIELAWNAPAACPTKERVLDDVARMVQAPPGGGGARKPIVARVTIVEKAGLGGAPTYQVDLVIDAGTRRLEGDRCEALGQAAAFILALAIDPNAKPLASSPPPPPAAASTAATPTRGGEGEREPGPTPAPPATPATAATPAPTTETPPTPPAVVTPAPASPSFPSSERSSRVTVAAEAALDLNVLPKPALGPMLAVGVRFAPLPIRAEVFGALFFEQTTALSIPGANIGAHVSGVIGGARVAFPFEVGSGVEVGPAAGVILHALQAKAFGATNSADGSAQWLGVLVGGHLAWRLHPSFALRADLHADIALARPEFVIDDAGTVHRPPALSGCAAVGPELRFF